MQVQQAYQVYAQFYDSFIGYHKTEDIDFYVEQCASNVKLLEIGCGTGRVLQGLAKRGFINLTGVDISGAMLDQAKKKLAPYISQHKIKLLNHNLIEAPLTSIFEVAIIPFYTLNYILEQIEDFLTHLRLSLEPQSLLLLDLYRPYSFTHPELNDIWQEKTITHEGKPLRVRDKRVMRNNFEMRRQIYTFKGEKTTIDITRRYFSPSEICRILKHTGFNHIEIIEGNKNLTNCLSLIKNNMSHKNQVASNFFVKAQAV
jgi:SAM-dependent methyltransferase